jgi:DNA-directed RNA polymerase specialized sigma24 family protein
MDDREVVAAIAAGDRAGIATAYDKYAAGLYGYCHWMLGGPADAAEALRDTFAAALGNLPEAPEPRPWLYALARNECQRRLVTTSPVRGEEADPTDQRTDTADQPIDVDQPPDATLQFRAVRELADVPEPPDATLQFRAVRELADVPEPPDATLQFRAVPKLADVPEPPDATLQFRAVPKLADVPEPPDATLQFRAVRELADVPQPPDATLQFNAVRPPSDTADRLTGANGDRGQAELRPLIRTVLAGLEPGEREVIELSLRHDLYDTDLATALGESWSQAHALTSRARGHLEKDLGALLVAHIGREDCPVLGTLLPGWDGQLTEQTHLLVDRHIEQCEICACHRRAALRPAVLSGLPPLAALPPRLRDDVLGRCSPAAVDTPPSQPSASTTRFARWSAAIKAISWDSIRSRPGAATAATAIMLWLAAAVSVTVLTLTGSHSAHALVTRPSVSARPNTPPATTTHVAARPTTPPTTRTAAAARPSPTGSQPYLVPSAGPSTTASSVEPSSASPSPSPSKSPSPSPSKSPSPSPSRSVSPSP